MKLFSSLRTAVLVATATLLSAGAQAGPMPTNVAAMKSMIDQNTTEVRYRGGYRGGRVAYRGRVGYRRLGYGVAAGAIVAGAVAHSAYYGDGGYYGGGYPAYGYAAPYGYGGYGYGAVPYGYGGGYVVRRHYGW